MKKTNTILTIIAFVFSIGTAFGAHLLSQSRIEYIAYRALKNQTSPCTMITCDTNGTVDCVNYATYNTYEYKSTNGVCLNVLLNAKRP